MRHQKIEKKEPKRRPNIIDLRRPPAGVTMRTVIFVELGDMSPEQFSLLAARYAQEYQGMARGDHYFCPVRGGQIRNDPYFETEFLKIVEQTCEVKDGKIALKGNITPVQVIREFVGA